MGRPLMPHQRHVVDVGLEVQSEAAGDPSPGEWAYSDVDLTIQRRGGKTSIIAPVTAHRAERVERALILMTAQKRDKAKKRWLEVTEDILRSPLRDDVRRKIGNMNEELRWKRTGSTLGLFAPKEDETHGDTLHLIWLDELWAFTDAMRAAIQAGYVPAFATTDGQAWKMSTQGTAESDWLNSVTKAGRASVKAGRRRGTAFFEWSLPDEPYGVKLQDLEDEQLVQACIDWHPAICHFPGCPGPRGAHGLVIPCPHGFTVRPAALWQAFDVIGRKRAEFIRAYGNRASDDLSKSWAMVSETTFLGAQDERPIPADASVSLGVAVDEDSADAGVSAGWRDPAGVMHTELVKSDALGMGHRLGTRWVPGFVTALAERQRPRAVAVTNVGPGRDIADQLEKPLEDLGIALVKVSQADLSAASVRHVDEMSMEPRPRWRWAFAQEVYDAAQDAVEGRGRVWSKGPEGGPVSAVLSHTLAGWAHDHAPEPVKQTSFWMG
jgi:hypothetical protein